MSPTVNHRQVARVLAGADSYDSLDESSQAIVRELWTERAEKAHQALNFAVEFTAAGESYAELDADGNVVIVDPAH